MMSNKLKVFLLIFLYSEFRLLSAEEVPNTSSNQGNSPSSVLPRFFDPGSMGFPNFGSGGFGNPTSNYPVNSFFPNGNQNINNPQQQPRPGLGIQNQPPYQGNLQGNYPNQQRFPYLGDSMNPGSNYNSNEGSPWSRPNEGGYPGRPGYPYGGDEFNNANTQYNLPPHYNQDTYPGSINPGRPTNLGINYNNPVMPGQDQQDLPPTPGQMGSNFQPDDLSNFQNPNIQYMNRPYGNQPNLYYPQPRPAQNYPYGEYPYGVGTGFSRPSPADNILDSSIQFPTESPPLNIVLPTDSPASTNPLVNPDAPLTSGSMSNGHPQLSNNPPGNVVDNTPAAILGKPVVVPPVTASPSQVVFDSSSESPTQKKCVQDCQSTSEYNPVCGSNNVTYINPGKFVCARNCGEAVYVRNEGKCEGDV